MKKLLLLFCVSVVSFSCLDVRADAFVSSFVQKELAEKGKASVFIVLKEQAQPVAAQSIIDRTQRIRYVYDQLRMTALKTQGPVLQYLESEKIKHKSFYLINAIVADQLTSEQVQKLSRHSQVAAIQLDVKSRLSEINREVNSEVASELARSTKNSMPPADPKDIPDHLKAIQVDKVWARGIYGEGIVIAGQDSGYKWDHPALIQQYRGYSVFGVRHDYNWHDAIHETLGGGKQSCGFSSAVPCDDKGHGTHTMGTMLGFEFATQKNRIGVAPKSKWIGCRNMELGLGKASTYLECFEFLLAPYPRGGNPKVDGEPSFAPHIINNSWSCPANEGCTGNEFFQAIENLKLAGIAVVASAGNDGSTCGSMKNAPGFYTGRVFAVAAASYNGSKIADFSSRGPSRWDGGVGPNISAPGEDIRSAVSTKDLYDYKSGTSMAGPHVAGVIALMWSARPELIGQVDQTMQIIQKTAMPKTSTQTCGNFRGSDVPNAVFGYGLINADAAIQAATSSVFSFE